MGALSVCFAVFVMGNRLQSYGNFYVTSKFFVHFFQNVRKRRLRREDGARIIPSG